MHKIEAPGATQDNTFTDGNPSTGTEPTTVNAAWLNAVQAEIVKVIEGAGLTLKTEETESGDQLLSALNAMGVNTGQFQNYSSLRTYSTGEVVRGSDGVIYEFYDRDQVGAVQGTDPTDPLNRPHIWMEWDGVKPGATIEWRSETLPEGYVENDGAEISRADYRRIYAVHGTTYGAGDGATTFLLPDDRGEFKRGLDRGRGIDAGRTLSAHQLDALQQMYGEMECNRTNLSAVNGGGVLGTAVGGSDSPAAGSSTHRNLIFDASRVARTADETRSRNNAVIYLTKI